MPTLEFSTKQLQRFAAFFFIFFLHLLWLADEIKNAQKNLSLTLMSHHLLQMLENHCLTNGLGNGLSYKGDAATLFDFMRGYDLIIMNES